MEKTYTLEDMQIMVEDWLADHWDEMGGLVVDWSTYDPEKPTVEARDTKHSYSLYADKDGFVHIYS